MNVFIFKYITNHVSVYNTCIYVVLIVVVRNKLTATIQDNGNSSHLLSCV